MNLHPGPDDQAGRSEVGPRAAWSTCVFCGWTSSKWVIGTTLGSERLARTNAEDEFRRHFAKAHMAPAAIFVGPLL